MRLVAGLLAVTLFAPLARADEPAPPSEPAEVAARPKLSLRVVRVMPESHQALLYDRARATHVLAEVGRSIEGYRVESIDDDEVTLSAGGTQVVLAAPARGRRGDPESSHRPTRARGSASGDAASPAPVDPYGEAAIRVVEAPVAPAPAAGAPRAVEPGADGVRVVSAAPERASEAGALGEPGEPVRVASAATGPISDGHAAPRQTGSTPAIPATTNTIPTTESALTAPQEPAHLAPERDATPPPASVDDPPPVAAAAAPIGAAPASTGIAPAPTGIAPAPTGIAPAPTGIAPAPIDTAAAGSSRRGAPTAAAPSRAVPRAKPSGSGARSADEALALADALTGGGARPGVASTTAPSVLPVAEADAPRAPAGTTVLARADVDAALAQFATLAAALRGSFSAAGVVLDAVGEGSIFHRAGLRAGDVVTSVDGAPLRSLDDAANLYARAASARSVSAQVLRGGAPVTLRVAIQ